MSELSIRLNSIENQANAHTIRINVLDKFASKMSKFMEKFAEEFAYDRDELPNLIVKYIKQDETIITCNELNADTHESFKQMQSKIDFIESQLAHQSTLITELKDLNSTLIKELQAKKLKETAQ